MTSKKSVQNLFPSIVGLAPTALLAPMQRRAVEAWLARERATAGTAKAVVVCRNLPATTAAPVGAAVSPSVA